MNFPFMDRDFAFFRGAIQNMFSLSVLTLGLILSFSPASADPDLETLNGTQHELASVIRIDHNTLLNFDHKLEHLTVKSLHHCPGWHYDSFWKRICPPEGCIAESSAAYSWHSFTISLKDGQRLSASECTRTVDSPTEKWLTNISLGIEDYDQKCVASETCDSAGKCKRVYGTRSRAPFIAAHVSGGNVVSWHNLYTPYSSCH